ncbi:hypothetical protein [Caproiciproducens faecalis]|uniref:Uncharacterized protein n=1 Tax=Caproiciproducens faecalis TaxID=2820301 RepID=A0ABS7DRA4_9FIRM|nr:hypothetical protein [Caproiciproducens faecalis]MBW7573837.1 hypothetical protein [Caproiciproducens faecalis]
MAAAGTGVGQNLSNDTGKGGVKGKYREYLLPETQLKAGVPFMTIILITLYLAVIFFDFIPLTKKGDKKTNWVYSVFLAASFLVLILSIFDIVIPGPSGAIKQLVGFFTSSS